MIKVKLIAAVLVFFTCMSAMAQMDVEIGGDIQVRGIYRNDFGLTTADSESEDWFDSWVRAYVKGTPSPGLSAMVRVICERDWGAEGITTVDPLTGKTETTHTTQVDIDLGYLTLEDAWGSPATIILGRQDLLYGEGFLVGRNNTYRTGYWERSPRKAFDAIKVSFGLIPFTLDLFTAIIEERYTESDVNLYGVNLTYDYLGTAALDIGLFYKNDHTKDSSTIALSIRGESEIISIPGLKLKAEIVPEIGKHNSNRDLQAYGGIAGIHYGSEDRLCFIQEPYIALNYILMSGESNPDAATGDYKEFDPLYEDEIYGWINELDSKLGLNTNAKIIDVRLGGKLTDVVSLQLDYYIFNRDKAVSGSTDFGSEIDLKLTYEYTEDVYFALTACYFDPDSAIGTESPIQVTGSVRMAF